jgi:hypothetical protein
MGRFNERIVGGNRSLKIRLQGISLAVSKGAVCVFRILERVKRPLIDTGASEFRVSASSERSLIPEHPTGIRYRERIIRDRIRTNGDNRSVQ